MTELILTCIITKEKGRYASQCPELDVASMGDSPEEAQKNLQEAIAGHLQVAREEGLLDPILERLGISKDDLKKKEHIIPTSFSSSIGVPLPA
ncbi:MAG TPA: type II toxin-antitoxin system HicB family antitoxin [Candidatus Nanoarchaeia archaeon]|nr:type II toxin-antitoxin system HicB family antitoxin [Candidatus Nanoarchaeia archaeon]